MSKGKAEKIGKIAFVGIHKDDGGTVNDVLLKQHEWKFNEPAKELRRFWGGREGARSKKIPAERWKDIKWCPCMGTL